MSPIERPRSDDSAAVLASVLARFLADHERGDLAPLASYQTAYPGYEELVAEEFGRWQRADEDDTGLADDASFAIGHYRVLRELGRGGQGAVFLAEDEQLQRRVALKVLHVTAGLSAAALQRFRREAEIASRLDHPRICPVYDVGSDRGTLWIAMRYVEGETLAERIAAAREAVSSDGVRSAATSAPSARAGVLDVVHLVEQAARALHEAHVAGIVHRDIKPGNIIVTPKGEPVILDFGLARDVDSRSVALTRTGERFGTPMYMSPEQLSGERSLVDRRADVWALGATLYECLTLRPPFDGPTSDRVESNILTRELMRAARHNPQVPKDLEVVLEKALEKDLSRRYSTALAFAEDLARVRTHRPVAARRAGPGLRLWRWTQRNPLAASFIAVLVLALAGSLYLLQQVRANERRARALALAGEAEAATAADPRLGLRLALAAVGVARIPETVSEVHRAVAALHETAQFRHGGRIHTIRLSRDGTRLLSSAEEGAARIRSLDTGSEVVLPHEQVSCAVFSPDETLVLTASDRGSLKIWRADGQPVREFAGYDARWGRVSSAMFSPDGERVLTGSGDGKARLWDLDGELRQELAAHRGQVWAQFSPDGKRVLTHAWDWYRERHVEDREVRLYEYDGEALALLEPLQHEEQPQYAGFSPQGRYIVTCCRGGMARLWDGRDGHLLHRLPGHANDARFGVFSPDEELVLTTATDGTVRLWNTADGRSLQVLRGFEWVKSAAFSPRGDLIVTGGVDQTVRVWNLAGALVAVFRGHRDAELLAGVGFVPGQIDPPQVYSGAEDGTIRVWDLWNPDLPVLIGHRGAVVSVDFCPQTGILATGSKDGTVRLWNQHGALQQTLEVGHQVGWVDFAPGGRQLARTDANGTITLWDLKTGELHRDPIEMRRLVWDATYAPDGRTLRISTGTALVLYDLEAGAFVDQSGASPHSLWAADNPATHAPMWSPAGDRVLTGSDAGSVWLWSRGGEALQVFDGHDSRLTVGNFHPDGERILTSSFDGKMILWDDTGRVLEDGFLTPGIGIYLARFSPDGDRIVSAHWDGAARVWNLQGELLATLHGHDAILWDALFVKIDGGEERLVTISGDGRARFWFAHTEDLLAYAEARAAEAPRELTAAERRRYAALLDLPVEPESSGVPRQQPRHAKAYRALGDARRARGELVAAATAYRRALAHRPEDVGTRSQLARVLAAQGQIAAARAVLEEATAQFGERPQPWLALAWFLVSPGGREAQWDAEAGLAAAETAVRWAGAGGDAGEMRDIELACESTLGVARYRAVRYREALRTLRDLDAHRQAEGLPRSACDLAIVAVCHDRLGQPQEAAAALRAARDLSERQPAHSGDPVRGSLDEDERAAVGEAEAAIGR